MRVQILSVCFLVLVASSHVIGVSIAPRFKRVRDRIESRAEVQNRDAIVDTFLGAMDEEAYYTLHNVLQHQKSGVYTNVLVVERSNAVVDGNAVTMLFERPIDFVIRSNSDLTKSKVYHAFPKASEETASKLAPLDGNAVVDETTFSGKFVKQLHTALKTDATNWKHLEAKLGNAPKSNLEKQFHVYSFGTPSGTGKVAIVIRIAEMGLQPDLVWPLVHPIYAAIKAAGGAHVNVLAVAAGGVTNKEDFPGKNHLLHKSLFVGFQVKSDGTKVAPLVSLSDDSASAPTNLLAADFAGSGAKANQEDQADTVLTAAKTYYQDTTKDWSSVAGTTSLTVAFFGGEDEKKRGNTLKLHDVNMEDYFYILFANKIRADNAANLPTLSGVAVFRVDCDPYDVSSFVESYNAWTATQKSMKRSALVDIIMWGLEGQNLNALPAGDALLWKTYFPSTMDNALTKAILDVSGTDKNFVRLGGNVLHPFLLEVATDLLKDSQKLDTTGTDVKAKAIQALASKTRSDVVAFVDEWAKFLWAKRKDATREDTANTGDIVPVWVRNKWFIAAYVASDREKVKVTNSLEFFKATPVAVDRSFYKASNVAGLKQLNELLFANKRTPYDFAVRHAVCADFKESTTKLCDNIPKLKHILAHDDSFNKIYTQPCATHESSARSALNDFCDDAKAKVNKFF